METLAAKLILGGELDTGDQILIDVVNGTLEATAVAAPDSAPKQEN